MSLISILETLLIGPLKLIFEIIFELAHRLIRHPGLAIIALSLVMNILVLPLYKRADAVQEENRNVEARPKAGVDHIKKVFTGDERMMITQTYYRQNNYKPTDVLNGSVSLLLEVPFFMAAYQFLSHLELLEGVSLGDGPIDAAFLAVEQITGQHYELDDFQIQAVTEGREAMGQTVVKLRANGKVYSGRGISTDIVGASIHAYINALNKIVYEEDNA
jgi:hypothetical protein